LDLDVPLWEGDLDGGRGKSSADFSMQFHNRAQPVFEIGKEVGEHKI
jgi:hypothetical protein